MISPSRLTVPDDVVSEVLDGEAVLLNLRTGVYFGLNQTGTRIWQLLGEHSDLDRVASAMAAEFDCDRQTLDADIRQLLEELESRGLLARSAQE